MDSIAAFNKERWEELSAAGVQYAIPLLNLDQAGARTLVDPEGQLGDVTGRKVLCLAASGGQQSVAFALLGALVTVLDISENQLEKDRQAAKHYGLTLETIQGDMQDLSELKGRTFDVVWLAHSINFVPRARLVIDQIAGLIKPRCRLRMSFTNPYVHGAWQDAMGNGFLLSQDFIDGGEVHYRKREWTITDPDGKQRLVEGPREYRHSLSTIINTLINDGFVVDGFWEEIGREPDQAAGTWEHFMKIAPPWLTIWATKGEIGKESGNITSR